MSTDIRQPSKEVKELMARVVPSYPMLAPNLGSMNQHTLNADKVTYTIVNLDKDSATPSLMHPEMTEVNHINAGTVSLAFHPYLLGFNYRVSHLQAETDDAGVVNAAVRELSILFDTQTILGTALNNGLISSNSSKNPFYTELALDSTLFTPNPTNAQSNANALKTIFETIEDRFATDNGARALTIYYWGEALSKVFNATSPELTMTVRKAAEEVFTIPVSFVKLPKIALQSKYITKARANSLPATDGMVAVDSASVRVDYTQMPAPVGVGDNTEEEYRWTKMRTGSVAVSPVRESGIVLQTLSIEDEGN